MTFVEGVLFVLILSIFLAASTIKRKVSRPVAEVKRVVYRRKSPHVPILLIRFTSAGVAITSIHLRFRRGLYHTTALSRIRTKHNSTTRCFTSRDRKQFAPSFSIVKPIALSGNCTTCKISRNMRSDHINSVVTRTMQGTITSSRITS